MTSWEDETSGWGGPAMLSWDDANASLSDWDDREDVTWESDVEYLYAGSGFWQNPSEMIRRQTFKLVVPRAERYLEWGGNLGEMLFGGSAKVIVDLLAVPARPQLTARPTNSPSDKGAHVGEPSKAVHEVSGALSCDSSDEIDVNHPVTILHLPTELLLLVFDCIESIEDFVCFGLARRYFWTLAQGYLHEYYQPLLGPWAGKNIYITLASFANRYVSRRQNVADLREESLRLLSRCMEWSEHDDPASMAARSEPTITESTYFPQDEPWILRNLTTREFVRAEAIALRPEYIHGPHILVLGFGEVVLSRICWSTDDNTGVNADISRGVWAGHCFDITTLARHQATTDAAEWTDVSDEVAREIADIWRSEFGADAEDLRRDLVR